MNKFLKKEYDKEDKDLTINNIFREMYGPGFINNFENWVEYRQNRNITSNEYDYVFCGSVNQKVLPLFNLDLKPISPLCASTIFLHNASPTPEPCWRLRLH